MLNPQYSPLAQPASSSTPHLRQLSITDSDAEVLAVIRRFAHGDIKRKAFANMAPHDARILVNDLQQELDARRSNQPESSSPVPTPGAFRRRAIRLLVKLSLYYSVLPDGLFLRGVYCPQKLDPVMRGGFADIFLGTHEGIRVAIKRLRTYVSVTERDKVHDLVCKEATLWRQLDHAHILPFLGVDRATFAPYYAIVSPWMSNGNLIDYIEKTQAEPSRINRLLTEVTYGLCYLHGQHIVHGDLRAANILIDDSDQARIADFGLTRICSATSAASSAVSQSNARWLAPELLLDEGECYPSPESDIYALGRVCLEAYTLKVPWWYIPHESRVIAQLQAGQEVRRPSPQELGGREMSTQFWSILRQCWLRTPPSARPAASKIITWLEPMSDMTDKPAPLTPPSETPIEPPMLINAPYHPWSQRTHTPDGTPSGPSRIGRPLFINGVKATLPPVRPTKQQLKKQKSAAALSSRSGRNGESSRTRARSRDAPAPTRPPWENDARSTPLPTPPRPLPIPGDRGHPSSPIKHSVSPTSPRAISRPSTSSPSSSHAISSSFDESVNGLRPRLADIDHPDSGGLLRSHSALALRSGEETIRPDQRDALINSIQSPAAEAAPPRTFRRLPPVPSQIATYSARSSPAIVAPPHTPTAIIESHDHAVAARSPRGPHLTLRIPPSPSSPRDASSSKLPSARPNSSRPPSSASQLISPNAISPLPSSATRGAEVFRDAVDYPRPPAEQVYDRLDSFFPKHDLDETLVDVNSGLSASPVGLSPTEQFIAPAAADGQSERAGRYRKSIRVAANEQRRKMGHGRSSDGSGRKRTTMLWGSKPQEVTTNKSQAKRKSVEQSPKPVSVFKWIRGELIGAGTYGRVYLALNAGTGEMIAVKQVEIPRTASDRDDQRQISMVETLKSEYKTLQVLDHPHVVQYLGFEETPSFFSIFLEYVPGGSIRSCLRKHGAFQDDVTKSFLAQILNGLSYLHSQGVLHRDLKADNILVENNGICKITDFGTSKRTDSIYGVDATRSTRMQGTIYWMAPEVVSTQPGGYDCKVDIWSVGCIALEMWSGRRPWYGQEEMQVLAQLYEKTSTPPTPSEAKLSAGARAFRDLCFTIDPCKRPTAAELEQHAYLSLPEEWVFMGFE